MSRVNKKPHPKASLRILVTSGPTREFIDPIRFISNPSTGALGYEIANVALRRGHKVILISGPTYLSPPKRAKFIPVVTALDMKTAAEKYYPFVDCLIMVGAVSDYRPTKYISRKIKKIRKRLIIELKRNPDILLELGKRKEDRILVGFSLETESLIKNAKQKLKLKNLDLIVSSLFDKSNPPFGSQRIRTIIIDREGKIERFFSSKNLLSKKILAKVERML
ncbi:MAG: hypothetical protein AMJ78_01700 [Omnitrophica WOR_2 bacterium SM23_29]|nr:MAG: hypothetical protein AMJ78_01700 [Omnitrophica WOR_2 bacterium SM23_29]